MKITWKIIDGVEWCVDEYNNRNSVKFGSREEAEEALRSLYNCSNCIDCRYCENCSNCTNCKHCENCIYCEYCFYCSNCKGCIECTNCRYCENCRYYKNCTNYSNCTNCDNLNEKMMQIAKDLQALLNKDIGLNEVQEILAKYDLAKDKIDMSEIQRSINILSKRFTEMYLYNN